MDTEMSIPSDETWYLLIKRVPEQTGPYEEGIFPEGHPRVVGPLGEGETLIRLSGAR